MKWGRCLFDFGWHAVDERRDYSDGVLEAECGHLLPMVALHDEPAGRPCEACASLQLARAQTTTASVNTDTATGVSGHCPYTPPENRCRPCIGIRIPVRNRGLLDELIPTVHQTTTRTGAR